MSTPAPAPIAPPISTKVRTRVNWTPAERAQWLSLFEKSGQSVSEFCRANDLPPATPPCGANNKPRWAPQPTAVSLSRSQLPA